MKTKQGFTLNKKSDILIVLILYYEGGGKMGMSDQQFEVYNALITFIDELIDREQDENEKEKLKKRKKNILANNKEVD